LRTRHCCRRRDRRFSRFRAFLDDLFQFQEQPAEIALEDMLLDAQLRRRALGKHLALLRLIEIQRIDVQRATVRRRCAWIRGQRHQHIDFQRLGQLRRQPPHAIAPLAEREIDLALVGLGFGLRLWQRGHRRGGRFRQGRDGFRLDAHIRSSARRSG
jgi:hypothetical protein